MRHPDHLPEDLVAAAAAVSDSRPIDWSSVEGSGGPGRVVQRLRQLERVGRAFRDAPRRDRPATSEALFTWGGLEVLERVGEGSFGEVFRAWDPVLERVVALKLRRRGPSSESGGGRRFLAEAQRLARVRHPNVLVVHGADIHDGRVGLETDFIEGTTLEEELEARGPYGPAEATSVVLDLCRALAAVHAAGIVHGDVKASNVLRETGGRIVLMDFGAAGELGPDGRRLGLMAEGTPMTIAPEILEGERATPRSDLYSVGVLLYRLLSGHHPVGAESIYQLLDAHREKRSTPLRDHRPDLPADLVDIVERAIAVDPGRRFSSAGDMERALLRLPHQDRARSGRRSPRRARVLRVSLAAAAAAAVAAAMALLPPGPRDVPSDSVRHRVAVLPFEDVSVTGSATLLASAIDRGLVDELARVGALRVIARSSAQRAAGSGESLQEVARTLAADRLCTGDVARQNDGAVRVSVQLVDPTTSEVMWADRFERPAGSSVSALLRDIVPAMAGALEIELTPDPSPPRIPDPDAMRATLEARYHWDARTSESLARAVALLRHALDLDPTYAPAWAALADAYNVQASYGWAPPGETFVLARAAAERALTLNERSADAHLALAGVLHSYFWRWSEAERHFQRSIELAPSNAVAHKWYAELLACSGRFDDALRHAETAFELDPLSPSADMDVGKVLYWARRWDAAIAHLAGTVRRHPGYVYGHFYLALAHAGRGELPVAIESLEALRERWPDRPDILAVLASSYASAGDTRAARDGLAELETIRSTDGLPPFVLAVPHIGLGDHDASVDLLGQAVEARDWRLGFVGVEPLFDPLRGDARFDRIVRRVGAVSS